MPSTRRLSKYKKPWRYARSGKKYNPKEAMEKGDNGKIQLGS